MRKEVSSSVVGALPTQNIFAKENVLYHENTWFVPPIGVAKAYALESVDEGENDHSAPVSAVGFGDGISSKSNTPNANIGNYYVQFDVPAKEEASIEGTSTSPDTDIYVKIEEPIRKAIPLPSAPPQEVKVVMEDTRYARKMKPRPPPPQNLQVIVEKSPLPSAKLPSPPSEGDMQVKLEKSVPKRVDPPQPPAQGEPSAQEPIQQPKPITSTKQTSLSQVATMNQNTIGDGKKKLEMESIRPETYEYLKGKYVLTSHMLCCYQIAHCFPPTLSHCRIQHPGQSSIHEKQRCCNIK